MKLATVGALITAAVSSVQAFENASPFLLLSSKRKVDFAPKDKGKPLNAQDATSSVLEVLKDCPADAYLLVHQPGLHSSDLAGSRSSEDVAAFGHDSTPKLAELVGKAASSHEMDNMFHKSKRDHKLGEKIADKCQAKTVSVSKDQGFEPYTDTKPRVIAIDFAPLPKNDKSKRKAELRGNDDVLYSVVSHLPSDNYVLVYTSTPYHESREEVTLDHKDDPVDTAKSVHGSASSSNVALNGTSVFENYSFFSAGIFMSLLVSIILAVVFYEGLNWLASIQVTYKSFDKEFVSGKQKK